jgi:hypothetical protein
MENCGKPLECKGFCGMHYQRFRKYGTPEDNKNTHGDLETRLLRRLNKTPTCWLWTGAKRSTDYGSITSDGPPYRILSAHRAAYEIYKGPIPDGMVVMHKCDTPLCCNPDHLELGTHKENTQDMIQKGRRVFPKYACGMSCGNTVLNEEKVRFIRSSLLSSSEIAKQLGVGETTIRAVRKNITWRHVE